MRILGNNGFGGGFGGFPNFGGGMGFPGFGGFPNFGGGMGFPGFGGFPNFGGGMGFPGFGGFPNFGGGMGFPGFGGFPNFGGITQPGFEDSFTQPGFNVEHQIDSYTQPGFDDFMSKFQGRLEEILKGYAGREMPETASGQIEDAAEATTTKPAPEGKELAPIPEAGTETPELGSNFGKALKKTGSFGPKGIQQLKAQGYTPAQIKALEKEFKQAGNISVGDTTVRKRKPMAAELPPPPPSGSGGLAR
jgi:hypothetical protein